MSGEQQDKLPPGRQPYDPLNGLRIGALTGGIAGAIVAGLTGVGIWFVFLTAIVAAAVGYWTQKRKLTG
ncbi:MAG: hypothetical protein QNJ89_13295 [Acidimicrobiia bacterium]|nr:hypothetical protein [Acidimicrobiia bacterium]